MQVKPVSITVFSVLFSLLLPSFVYAQGNQPKVVSIPDPNLAAAIRQEIGNSITTRTLLNLTRLEALGRRIKNLTGLQYARNLKVLILYTNKILDISALAGLTQLTELILRSNNILDISPLAALKQLTWLELGRNNISDLSALAALKQLTWLYLGHNNISDISALAELKQLTYLGLEGNNISDISPLTVLKQLKGLDLGFHNSISDISALAELKQLTSLDLGSNSISDISALAELKQLTKLGLFSNNITDISPLAALKQLTWLDIPLNTISDVSPLARLKKLTWLRLASNNISDVSPIVGLNLTGTEWDSTGLYIEQNPLSYVSINTHIPAMQARGIKVAFDTRVPTTLVKVSGIAQQGGINSAVPFPFVVEVRDEQNRAFAGVPVKFAIIGGGTGGGGRLSATTVTTDATGQAATQLRMGPTLGTTIVRVTAAHILKPIQFTAMAIPRSTPVPVPDATLRARITETLRKPPDATLTAADMLKLRALIANDAGIHDLTGLQHASNLTILSLNNNRISDVSPLVGLTQLTTLALRDNWISTVSPLVDLAQLRASTNLRMLYLQGNPLSDTAVSTHIPWLQEEGVDVRFDKDLTQSAYKVQLIYFRPRDRQPPPNINVKMDQLIKDVQQFYADQMEAHGFGRKTFQFETDAHGDAVVYHIVGKFEDADYADYDNNPFSEIGEQLGGSKRIRLIVLNSHGKPAGEQRIEPSIRLIVLDSDFYPHRRCGSGSGGSHSGSARIYGLDCLDFDTVAHELGHAFGLHHDFRSNDYMMSYGVARTELSQCHAEWLDVHRSFNTHRATVNAKTTIEMLSPSLASPPNAIRFRFKVTDPDGLHQAQLLKETLSGSAAGFLEVIACKHLNGKPSDTVNFTTTALGPGNKTVRLHVMDVHGNFPDSWTNFPVDVTSLLPPPEVVSIPDPNLAAAVRQEIGNSITTHTLLNLTHLNVYSSEIRNLTGLQHARNLRELKLSGNAITDISSLAELRQLNELWLDRNSITDISPLAELKKLTRLELWHNNITDISPLAELKKLTWLNLLGNNITDISPLAELKKLTWLELQFNSISDISALAELKQLTRLELSGNNITDISPLAKLKKLLGLDLGYNNITDISPLAELKQLEGRLSLSDNNITDISALAELKRLTWLELSGNNITDISPLAELKYLTGLKLRQSNVSDISALADLKQLTYLELTGNNIPDVSALADLKQLTHLELTDNNISDVSPLARLNLTGRRGNSTGLYLRQNPLSDASINTHIPAMQARGIEVEFDSLTKSSQDTGPSADVNGDGVVNVQDLVLVSSRLEEAGENVADVNRDGVVNIQDLVLVAGALGNAAAAPSVWHAASAELPSRARVEQWLTAAYRVPHTDARLLRGIDWLERLLAALPPEETALLANYPNPFNPETWMPYQLSEPAAVTVRIYSVEGGLVRTLVLGHQPAGMYHRKSRAAYWDGRNAQGEKVASGVYFYTLSAGDFTATRKMLIRK